LEIIQAFNLAYFFPRQFLNIIFLGEIGVLKEVPVNSPLEEMALQIEDLDSFDKYRVCIYNAYFWEQSNVDDSCVEFETTRSATSRSAAVDMDGNNNGGNLETLIGLMTGALVVILSLIIVAVLFWKSNRFSTGKMHDEYPRTTGNILEYFETLEILKLFRNFEKNLENW